MNRSGTLRKALESLSRQEYQPAEIIIVDASTDDLTEAVCGMGIDCLKSKLCWVRAEIPGAAHQRNQGVRSANGEAILFFDDDVIFEPDCLEKLWLAYQADQNLGGLNAMIVNQRYDKPGRISRSLFRLLHGSHEDSYAGKCIGPAFNLLPEDCEDLPDVVPVEWLNLGCTLYRQTALPTPPFPARFEGYSLMEDLTLSLIVGRQWKLANVRTARIFHDSRPGAYKKDVAELACMELVNRHYVMTEVLGRKRVIDYFRLALLQTFYAAGQVRTREGRRQLPSFVRGKLQGLRTILSDNHRHR